MATSFPSVELSIAATSEELAILSAAAQARHMSLKDFLRLQLMSVAKAAAKTQPESPAAVAVAVAPNLGFERGPAALKHAFLP
jgi:hypothetical protein